MTLTAWIVLEESRQSTWQTSQKECLQILPFPGWKCSGSRKRDGFYDVFKYELRGTNNIDEANTKDINAGTSIFEASGTITLKKQDATTQAQMVLLSKGRPQIIAEGYDGLFRIYGIKNGVDVTVNTASGADMNEFNGYTLTLASKEDNLAYFVASSLVVADAATGFDVQTN